MPSPALHWEYSTPFLILLCIGDRGLQFYALGLEIPLPTPALILPPHALGIDEESPPILIHLQSSVLGIGTFLNGGGNGNGNNPPPPKKKAY